MGEGAKSRLTLTKKGGGGRTSFKHAETEGTHFFEVVLTLKRQAFVLESTQNIFVPSFQHG